MWNNNNPTRFDFVGTGDEETSDCSKQTWTTIKSVGNVIWNNHDQEKTWFIEEEDRKEFMCFGIRILGIDGGTFAALQDIKMWTGEPEPQSQLRNKSVMMHSKVMKVNKRNPNGHGLF